jgi:Spy/CpxP family protein refolding chaperone
MVRQQQIQQQIDQNTALQQQMLSPQSDPADVNARLKQYDAQIQQLQQQPAPLPAPVR